MKNLAGDPDCDSQIENELCVAGIDIVRHDKRLRNEVPASITGEIADKGATFVRGWYYWIVYCDVGIELARAMYAVEDRRDVRVAGHCGAPHPDEWAEPSAKEIRRLCDEAGCDYELFKDMRRVRLYHIDTQKGLNFFARCIKGWPVEMASKAGERDPEE